MRRREATAKRYARPLLVLASEAGALESVGQELEQASQAIFGHRDLVDLLLRPWIAGARKRAVVREVARRLNMSTLLEDFLGLLAVRSRVDYLPDIAQLYRQLADEALGRARATVRSSVALNEGEQQALGAELGRRIGKQVVVESVVDNTLLGGFVVHIGSLVLDASLEAQLARLREHLVRGRR
ncbi:MAG: ATP synthase F1 subunit delta [Candidatus Methylomirabilia bacterium]